MSSVQGWNSGWLRVQRWRRSRTLQRTLGIRHMALLTGVPVRSWRMNQRVSAPLAVRALVRAANSVGHCVSLRMPIGLAGYGEALNRTLVALHLSERLRQCRGLSDEERKRSSLRGYHRASPSRIGLVGCEKDVTGFTFPGCLLE